MENSRNHRHRSGQADQRRLSEKLVGHHPSGPPTDFPQSVNGVVFSASTSCALILRNSPRKECEYSRRLKPGASTPAAAVGFMQQAPVAPGGECCLQRLRHDHEPHRNRRKSSLLFAGLLYLLEGGRQPHSEQVRVVRCSGTPRHMPPPRNRDFHVSMVLKSDQPASRTLFAMLVRASFDGLTLRVLVTDRHPWAIDRPVNVGESALLLGCKT
jgi:hypothetical protein